MDRKHRPPHLEFVRRCLTNSLIVLAPGVQSISFHHGNYTDTLAGPLFLQPYIEGIGNSLNNTKLTRLPVGWVEKTIHRFRNDCARNE